MGIPTQLLRYKCGHTENRDLSDVPAGKRKSRAKFYAGAFDCTKCFTESRRADQEADAKQRGLDAQTFQEEHSLPDLEGSEKQLRWASLVRHQTVAAVLDADDTDLDTDSVLDAVQQITWAGWWLENLGWKEVKEHDYGVTEFAELILTGPAAQADRDGNKAATATEYPF